MKINTETPIRFQTDNELLLLTSELRKYFAEKPADVEATQKEVYLAMILKEADEVLVARERSRRHLFYFCKEMEDKFFTEDKPHVLILTMLFDLAEEDVIKNFTCSMPPRGGKSHTSTLAIDREIGLHPERTHMRNSYSAKLAVDKLSHTVREHVKSEPFKRIFPEIIIDRNANKKDRWYLEGNTIPAYIASGIGGSVSGFGCDGFAVLDDEYADIGTASSEVERK